MIQLSCSSLITVSFDSSNFQRSRLLGFKAIKKPQKKTRRVRRPERVSSFLRGGFKSHLNPRNRLPPAYTIPLARGGHYFPASTSRFPFTRLLSLKLRQFDSS